MRACFAWLVSPRCLFWALLYINSSGGCVFLFRAIPFLSLETARVNPPMYARGEGLGCVAHLYWFVACLGIGVCTCSWFVACRFLKVNPLCLRLWLLLDPASRGSAPGPSFFSLALPVLSFSSELTPDLAVAPALCIDHKSSRTGSHNSSLSYYFSVFLSSVFAGHFLPVSCPYLSGGGSRCNLRRRRLTLPRWGRAFLEKLLTCVRICTQIRQLLVCVVCGRSATWRTRYCAPESTRTARCAWKRIRSCASAPRCSLLCW